MRIPPIPALLRQETINLFHQTESGYSSPITIPRCRVDRSAQLSPNDYELTIGCIARVFIDATEYVGEIYEGDLIEFDGEKHSVSTVNRCDHPDGTVHHWECDVQ